MRKLMSKKRVQDQIRQLNKQIKSYEWSINENIMQVISQFIVLNKILRENTI